MIFVQIHNKNIFRTFFRLNSNQKVHVLIFMIDTKTDEKKNRKCCYHFASILGFITLCFLYGTSYGLAILGLNAGYPGATLIALRMIFGFGATLIITVFRVIFEIKTRLDIFESLKNRKIDILKSAFGGIMYYGFPHSLIGVAQRSIPSNTVHIAQSCVPFFAFIFANFMLADEKFSFKRFYPQVLALIGTILTAIPTVDSNYGEGVNVIDYVYLTISIASFGFGSVYMKSHLSTCEPTLCGFFQMFGSAIYSLAFALGYDKPNKFVDSIRNPKHSYDIIWPVILGAVHTCGCTYVYLWTVKRLGAVISSFSNFGQIVIGVLIGVFFFAEWDTYLLKDYIMSAFGLAILTLAIICGLLGDRKKDIGDLDSSTFPLISENKEEVFIPEYENPEMKKPLLH